MTRATDCAVVILAPKKTGNRFIDYNLLKKQKLINKTNFFRHVRFDKGLNIHMDGRKRIAVVTWHEGSE